MPPVNTDMLDGELAGASCLFMSFVMAVIVFLDFFWARLRLVAAKSAKPGRAQLAPLNSRKALTSDIKLDNRAGLETKLGENEKNAELQTFGTLDETSQLKPMAPGVFHAIGSFPLLLLGA